MKRNFWQFRLVPVLVVSLGGVVFSALAWLAYVGIYLAIESRFYPMNPTDVPADAIRNACVTFFSLAYLIVLTTKWPDLLKATLLVGPLSMFLISVMLHLYMRPFLGLLAFLPIVGGCFILILYRKKPWYFSFSVALSLVLALLYSWPTA